jgi:hypothetical protein
MSLLARLVDRLLAYKSSESQNAICPNTFLWFMTFVKECTEQKVVRVSPCHILCLCPHCTKHTCSTVCHKS